MSAPTARRRVVLVAVIEEVFRDQAKLKPPGADPAPDLASLRNGLGEPGSTGPADAEPRSAALPRRPSASTATG